MTYSEIIKRISSVFIGLLIVVSVFSAVPTKVHAQFATISFDPLNWIENAFDEVANFASKLISEAGNNKEFVLDPLAWASKLGIQQTITKSMVNWVASGFNGSPAFVSDLKAHLLSVGDTVAKDFLLQLQLTKGVHSPFGTQVAQNVINNYYRATSGDVNTTHPYTLYSACAGKDAAFLSGDFSQCGFKGWIAAWSNQANNPRTSQGLLESELNARIATAQNERKSELAQNNGFLSVRKCDTTVATAGGTNLTVTDPSQHCSVVTPGSVVHDQLSKTLGSGVDTLVTADEIDETIGTLFTNLVSDVISKGLSSHSNSGGVSPPRPPAPADAGLVANFTQGVTTQIQQLQEYQANWQTILGAAQAAQAKLQTCYSSGNSDQAQSVIARATTELSRAASGLRSLAALQSQAAAVKNADDLDLLTQNYQTLLSGGVLPQATELGFAAEQSKDIPASVPAGTPQTLFSNMNRIAQSQCNAFNPVQ